MANFPCDTRVGVGEDFGRFDVHAVAGGGVVIYAVAPTFYRRVVEKEVGEFLVGFRALGLQAEVTGYGDDVLFVCGEDGGGGGIFLHK